MKRLNLRKPFNPNLTGLLFIFFIVMSACQNNQQQTIDLSGEWEFQMDPDDQGVDEKWFDGDFSETVQLPGSMVENGKGYDITLETEWTG
ncbi:MAG TPA: hypothetical protein VJ919_17305, partial [Tangfeifania sp.]|nr:hypothetical protein [Tangfeifania sp.]